MNQKTTLRKLSVKVQRTYQNVLYKEQIRTFKLKTAMTRTNKIGKDIYALTLTSRVNIKFVEFFSEINVTILFSNTGLKSYIQ